MASDILFGPNETLLLNGRFTINLKPKPVYAVTVSHSAVIYRAVASAPQPSVARSTTGSSATTDSGGGDDTSSSSDAAAATGAGVGDSWIALEDVVGCDCMKGKKASDSIAAYFIIYAYTRTKRSEKSCRRRETLTLRFDHFLTYNENLEEAQRWKTVIMSLIRRRRSSSSSAALPSPEPQKKLLVLVNPFSGPGKALHIFQQEVIPVFAEAGVLYHLFVTEYAGHAREMVRSMNLDEWRGIVIVSGDGLIFEVVNGLMERSDWERAIKMPLGTIPGGSGNALACAVCHHSGEIYLKKHVLHSSLIVARSEVVPMDLVAVDTCTGKRLYSFLLIGWGMMADVDIESEKYRHMGNARFAFMAVIKLAGMKKYRGRLSYLPCEGERSRGNHLPKYTRKIEGEVDSDRVVDRVLESDASCLQAADGVGAAGDYNCVPTPLLVPLSKPVPSNWVTMEDDFIMVGAVYQSHLAKDNMMAPNATLNDGIIYLVFVKGTIPRMRLAHVFATLDNGFEASNEDIEIIRVQAFRLEPLTPKGLMTVDGEVVDYGPIQAQVLPSMARIMSLGKRCDGSA